MSNATVKDLLSKLDLNQLDSAALEQTMACPILQMEFALWDSV